MGVIHCENCEWVDLDYDPGHEEECARDNDENVLEVGK